MTRFRFTVLAAALASASAQAAEAGRTEIERMVVRGTPEDQAALKKWLGEQGDRKVVEGQLLASGFRKEPSTGDCLTYSYLGRDAGTRDDRSATVTYCDGKLVWVAIWTLLPVDKNPKGPLPPIKLPSPEERGR